MIRLSRLTDKATNGSGNYLHVVLEARLRAVVEYALERRNEGQSVAEGNANHAKRAYEKI